MSEQMEVVQAEATGGWIPRPEGGWMEPVEVDVLATVTDNGTESYVVVGAFIFDGDVDCVRSCFTSGDEDFKESQVLAIRPLPKPYRKMCDKHKRSSRRFPIESTPGYIERCPIIMEKKTSTPGTITTTNKTGHDVWVKNATENYLKGRG